PFHAKFKISSITASVYLFDTTGYVLHKVENTPTLNANEAYALAEGGSFVQTDMYSPGFPNTQDGHAQYMAGYVMETGILVINEVCPAPRSGLRDEDGELSDWIELRNNGDTVIDLSRYALSDNEDRPAKWVFPEGAFIAPGGYFLVFASGKERDNPGGIPHATFSVAAEGEVLTLSTRQGQLLDRIALGPVPADFSYGRSEGGTGWRTFSVPTPGAPNNAAGARMADKFMRSLNEYGVYISEVISSNDTVQAAQGKPISDWVELYNASSEVRDISLWGLSDSVTWPRQWQFPQGTRIWPGEYKVVLLNKSAQAGTDASALAANFALARAGGEVMTLSDAYGRVLDRVVTPEIPPDVSYGRGAGMDGFFYFDTPTPGRENGIGFQGFAAQPTFSHQGGLYPSDITVSIEVPEGTEVRYTLDGSIPTIGNGTPYTEPLPIRDTTVLRARAFTGGLQPSSPVTATYVLKTYFSLPVVSLTTDPKELWDPATGMLALGEGVDILQYKSIPFRRPEPTYRVHGKEQRPGYAEMFDSATGKTVFSQGVTFGLIGQYSLDMPQKSFKVTARAKYGSKYFEAPLFEDRPFDLYKSFVLRVSGNDAVWTRMADGVQSRLVDQLDTTVIHQAWKPVIVYLNGKYWGHYNLRERVSRHFVAQHENIPMEQADAMTILEANGRSYWGSNAEYNELIKKAKTLSPGRSPADLQYLTDRIDVDNYFDYMILEAFFANTDTGNIRYYKLPGGKWKWILFDLDYGLFNSGANGIRNVLNPKGTGVNNAIDNTLIRKLLENDQMKDKFLRRFGEIFRQLTTDVMLRQIEECYAILQPEMMMHFERWASFNLKSISSDQPQTMDGSMRYWNERVDRMRNVVKKRPALCWDQVKEWFSLSDTQMRAYFGPRPAIPPDAI
ncbi:MAG TPA: CotH kinase family protein, partial [Candidatus Limnocylindria bacterium]|nr:CotH kinase family protein [Candidatus Limnocylindria bacterium]